MQTDHDQIFKTLIEQFFREFMELFYPEIAAAIDFASVEFLRQEHFTDLLHGDKKLMDLVAKVRLRNGEERLLLIHFEFESQRRATDYPRRLFEYYCVLFLRYGEDVISIALFTDDEEWKVPVSNVFDARFDGDAGVVFKYHILKLSSIDYRKFLSSGNPLAYALMAKMNWKRREIVRLKADFLRMILGTGIDPARESLLVEFVETYMPLVGNQQAEFLDLVRENEPFREVQKMVTSWELAGIEKGRAEGIEKGRKEGREEGALLTQRETLIKILQHRFGEVSNETVGRITQISEKARLAELIDQSLDVTCLTDLNL